MLERRIEQRLAAAVRRAGGLCLKWVSPSFAGVPDRICLLPGGRVVFVECKAPGKAPTRLQERVHGLLRGLGMDVRVIDSLEAADAICT